LKKYLQSILLLAGALVCALAYSAENTHQHKSSDLQRHGTHGMLVFSDGEHLYASHLPMFHPPHDVQLIFSFELADKVVESALIKALKSHNGYWTLAPEQFDLNNLGKDVEAGFFQFSADFYADHFERGGELKYQKQIVIFKQQAYREVLDKKHKDLVTLVRVTPEDAERVHYAQIIQGQPGVDQIFIVTPSISNTSKFSEVLQVKTSSMNLKKQDLAKALQIPVSDISILYRELGDLR